MLLLKVLRHLFLLLFPEKLLLLHSHVLGLDLLLLLLKLVLFLEFGTLLLFFQYWHHLTKLAHLLLFTLLVLLFLFTFGFLTFLDIVFEHLIDLALHHWAQVCCQLSLHNLLNLLWLLRQALWLLIFFCGVHLGLVCQNGLVVLFLFLFLFLFLLFCFLLLFLFSLLLLETTDEWGSTFEGWVGSVFWWFQWLFHCGL